MLGPIMLVKYDNKMKRQGLERPSTVGDNGNPDYDPHKILDKINNYKKPQTPNFDLMTSRPNEGDNLPSYMKVINHYFYNNPY